MDKSMAGEVLDFWFGELDAGGRCREDKSALWWGKSEQTDQRIKALFGPLLAEISRGSRAEWLAYPEGRLATIIVLDQFSRNIYRDNPLAFATDSLALSHTLEGIAVSADLALAPIQRVFFYLPLEHSEDMAMQEQSLHQYRRLLNTVPEQDKAVFQGYLDYAQKHADVIEQFGRYPHRNTVLGRENTEEEEIYLQQPGSGF